MKLNPPLGSYKPETRHLNLQWTVGDIDRMNFIRMNRILTLTEIDEAFSRRGLTTTRQRILELAKECRVQLREVARA